MSSQIFPIPSEPRARTSPGDAMIEAIAEAVAIKLERLASTSQRLLEIEEAAKYLGMTPHALRHKAGVEIPVCGLTISCALIVAISTATLIGQSAKAYKRQPVNDMPRGEHGTAKPYLRGKVWWIKYYVPGEPKPRYESSKSTNKTDAIRLLNQRRSEIDSREVSSANAKVRDLLNLYLADQRKQGRHSYKQADGYVRLHLDPAFGKTKASAITSQRIDQFIEQKQSADYANATINRWLEALRRAYTLGKNAMPPLVYTAPKIEKLEEDNVREGFLEHDQYMVFRSELPDHQRLILVIGYHLGMRRGEILKLRWDQVDWQENLIRLEKKQTKGKQARVAPLYGELRGWLEMAYAARGESEFIVSWKGEGISEVKTAWNKARQRAKVPFLLVHDLRRTAVRNMVRAGIPEKQAMKISGHRSRSIFDRYDITDERDIQIAGQKLARYLEGKTSSDRNSYK